MTEDATADPNAPPTCYRHPNRETHVRCSRCDRPICPDCMVDAAVGFQCPDCVREGDRDVRVGSTLSGGTIHRDPALITKILVGLNVAVYVLQYLSDGAVNDRFEMIGLRVAFENDNYRLLSAAFLHASITHLLLNMLALWVVGSVVEQRLGRWRYLTVYLVSALAGSVFSYAVDPVFQRSVGASGAVFGLFGALFILALKLRFDVRGIITIIAINVVIGFIPGIGINWRAHLGGLVAGALLTAAMVYAPQRSRVVVSIAAAAVIVLAALPRRSGGRISSNPARWPNCGSTNVVHHAVSRVSGCSSGVVHRSYPHCGEFHGVIQRQRVDTISRRR